MHPEKFTINMASNENYLVDNSKDESPNHSLSEKNTQISGSTENPEQTESSASQGCVGFSDVNKMPEKRGFGGSLFRVARQRWAKVSRAFFGIKGALNLAKADKSGFFKNSAETHELAAEGKIDISIEVINKKQLTSINYIKQGNASFYTTSALNERHGIRHAPKFLTAVKSMWNWLPHVGDPPVVGISKAVYCAHVVLVQNLLLPVYGLKPDPDYDPSDDWEEDSKGETMLNYPNFLDAMFELVDMWCDTINAGEYAKILDMLLDGCKKNEKAFWKLVKRFEPKQEISSKTKATRAPEIPPESSAAPEPVAELPVVDKTNHDQTTAFTPKSKKAEVVKDEGVVQRRKTSAARPLSASPSPPVPMQPPVVNSEPDVTSEPKPPTLPPARKVYYRPRPQPKSRPPPPWAQPPIAPPKVMRRKLGLPPSSAGPVRPRKKEQPPPQVLFRYVYKPRPAPRVCIPASVDTHTCMTSDSVPDRSPQPPSSPLGHHSIGCNMATIEFQFRGRYSAGAVEELQAEEEASGKLERPATAGVMGSRMSKHAAQRRTRSNSAGPERTSWRQATPLTLALPSEDAGSDDEDTLAEQPSLRDVYNPSTGLAETRSGSGIQRSALHSAPPGSSRSRLQTSSYPVSRASTAVSLPSTPTRHPDWFFWETSSPSRASPSRSNSALDFPPSSPPSPQPSPPAATTLQSFGSSKLRPTSVSSARAAGCSSPGNAAVKPSSPLLPTSVLRPYSSHA